MSEENGKFELEGEVEHVKLTRDWDDTGNSITNVLYVLIKDGEGLLHNTVLKSENKDLLKQLEHTIHMHDGEVKVTVEKDTKATKNEALPVYKALSQYQIM